MPLFILLHFVHLRSKRGKTVKFSNFALAKELSQGALSRNYLTLFLRSLILLLLVLAASGMIFEYIGTSSAFNFVLTVDTSASMSADDIGSSRLDSAKEAAINFVNVLPSGTKIGLVSFSGNSIIRSRLSSDRDDIGDALNDLEISEVGGTDMGSALVTSTNLLISEKKSKVIILLSDGRSNTGLNVEEAVDFANSYNIIVYTIGLGTEEGSFIEALDISSSLDEGGLRKIARDTGGSYFPASDEFLLQEAYRTIAGITKDKVAFEVTNIFLFLGALLLFISWVSEYFKYGIIP